MNMTSLLRYLIGDREAILTIAGTRHALWIGLLFVLSAGFAREYDKEDLLHEPGYAVIPVGASLASSFLLFAVAYGVAACRGASWRLFFSRYLAFLGLFWLAAPMAWLYAVPYERFLSPADAMRANLITLGIVSAWRVLLMVRVLMVLLGYGIWAAVSLVLLFADVVALSLLNFLPFPLIDVMGGIQLNEGEQVLREVAQGVCLVGICSFPIWFIGSIVAAFRSRPNWAGADEALAPRPSTPLVILAVGSVLIWAAVLPTTQPPQIRRRAVERTFRRGDVEGALRRMSQYDRTDFPAGWDPPPTRVSQYYRTGDPRLMRVLELLGEIETADWVREAYLDKAAATLGGWQFDEKEGVFNVARLLRRIPGGTGILDRMKDQRLADKVREALNKPDEKSDQ